MIKKLRLRFILSALFSIFLVLAATIAAINISNYVKAERDTAILLDQVVDREREACDFMGDSAVIITVPKRANSFFKPIFFTLFPFNTLSIISSWRSKTSPSRTR